MKEYYLIYKITNQINGKIYIGCHKTKDVNDGYMGSGKYLKRSQEKYGIENFTKEILQVFDNPDDMFQMESQIVNEEFIKRKDTYNIKEGGYGGWDYINSNGLSKNGGDKFAWYLEKLKDDDFKKIDNLIKSERFKRLHREGKLKYDNFTGKHHTEETKRKIGEANSKHQQGSKNSQYGTMWITNGKENKKIKKDQEIPEGWYKGRTMNG